MAGCIGSSQGGVEQFRAIRSNYVGLPSMSCRFSQWAPSDSGSYSRAVRKRCWSTSLSFLAESFSVERPMAPSPLCA